MQHILAKAVGPALDICPSGMSKQLLPAILAPVALVEDLLQIDDLTRSHINFMGTQAGGGVIKVSMQSGISYGKAGVHATFYLDSC